MLENNSSGGLVSVFQLYKAKEKNVVPKWVNGAFLEIPYEEFQSPSNPWNVQ